MNKNNTHKGDPYAAWAGAEDRLRNATDTIFELRNQLAALVVERDAAVRERDEDIFAHTREVDEFNSGYQAFENGLDVDSAEIEYYSILPDDIDHYDTFRIGYVWAQHKAALQTENKP